MDMTIVEVLRHQQAVREDHQHYVARHPEVFLEDMTETDLADFALRVCVLALNPNKSNAEAGAELREMVGKEIDAYMQGVEL